jgi:hypothetical protein
MGSRLRAAMKAASLVLLGAGGVGLLGAGGCSVTTTRSEPPEAWDSAVSVDAASSSGSSSGGFGGGDAGSCEPGSLATFRPATYHPASGMGQGLCVTGAQGDPIAGFYEACLGSDATVDGCNAFTQLNEACVACILTPETAAKYGPILNHGGFVTANVAGCLELAGDEQTDASESELPCAKTVQALAGCELAACEANCAVHDAASLAGYDACAANAEAAGCEMYATAAACADSEEDAGPLDAACLGDFMTFYDVVVPVFCGAPPDGGTSPSPDAGGGVPHDAAVE